MSHYRSHQPPPALVLGIVLAIAMLAPTAAAPTAARAATAATGSRDAQVHPRIMQEAARRLTTAPLVAPVRAGSPGSAPRRFAMRGRRRTGVVVGYQTYGFADLANDLGNSSQSPNGYTSWDFGLLSSVALFGLHVNSDGTLANDPAMAAWNGVPGSGFMAAARASGTRVDITIVLQDFGNPGDPSMCQALSGNAPATTIGQITAQVKSKQVAGVNVDYESVNAACGGSSTRDLLTSFVRRLRAALGTSADLVVDTYGSSAGDPGGFFDVPSMAPSASSFFVMAYDMDYSNWQAMGCPSYCMNPIAPLTNYRYNDTTIAAQYIGAAGAGKVILGVPYYGRTACVGAAYPNWYPTTSPHWGNPTYLDAISTSTTPGVSSYSLHRDNRDPVGLEPYSTWQSSTYSCTRESYWDDLTSLQQKYQLVRRDQVAGMGVWQLKYGGGDTGLWNLINQEFGSLPNAPTAVAADGADQRATVSWTPPGIDNGGPVTGYTITATSAAGAATTMRADGGAQSATFTGLTDGTTYTFTVYATNSSGSGPLSSPSNAITPTSAPRHRQHFAEGTTRPGFQEYLTILNTGADATATIGYLFGDGSPAASRAVVLPGHGRTTVDVNGAAGGGKDVALIVDSASATLLAERPMYFRGCQAPTVCDNGGDVAGATQPQQSWYFAEGTTRSGFQEYLTLSNPGPQDAPVTVLYLFPGGGTSRFDYPVSAMSRRTINVNSDVGAGKDVSIKVTSTGAPIVAERPMYFSTCIMGLCLNGGDVSPGGQPATTWDFAEGTTRAGFVEFLTILNPGSTTAKVTATYGYGPGQSGPRNQVFQVPPGRFTTYVNGDVGAGKDVSISLSSPDQKIVAERPMYFNTCGVGFCADGGHVALGSGPGTNWYFAEGYTGAGFQEYLSLHNPGPQDGTATITFFYSDGSTKSETRTVSAGSRTTVNVNQDAGGGHEVSATVTSTVSIVAERPMYFHACPGQL
ncbi:MAG: DUF5719 family protein, partial [Candidatus Dormibacteraceae bacterium]